MAENTKIEWADHTFNPWTGCTKISPACDHCYAESWSKRAGDRVGKWGPGAQRVRTSPANWKQPIKWNAEAERLGVRYRVFCASLADVFDNEVPEAWRLDLFRLIRATPHLDWLLLTKRIGNARIMLASVRMQAEEYLDPFPWPNVWIGATICNQGEADRDIPKLLEVPAAKRFLSIEPMLGPVSFEGLFASDTINDGTNALECIDWVIVGGESGHGARPMHQGWVRSLRDQCRSAGVSFLFKQWGEWAPGNTGPGADLNNTDRTKIQSGFFTYSDAWLDVGANPFRQTMDRVGKKAAGRLLDGREWNEVPA